MFRTLLLCGLVCFWARIAFGDGIEGTIRVGKDTVRVRLDFSEKLGFIGFSDTKLFQAEDKDLQTQKKSFLFTKVPAQLEFYDNNTGASLGYAVNNALYRFGPTELDTTWHGVEARALSSKSNVAVGIRQTTDDPVELYYGYTFLLSRRRDALPPPLDVVSQTITVELNARVDRKDTAFHENGFICFEKKGQSQTKYPFSCRYVETASHDRKFVEPKENVMLFRVRR